MYRHRASLTLIEYESVYLIVRGTANYIRLKVDASAERCTISAAFDKDSGHNYTNNVLMTIILVLSRKTERFNFQYIYSRK